MVTVKAGEQGTRVQNCPKVVGSNFILLKSNYKLFTKDKSQLQVGEPSVQYVGDYTQYGL